MSGEVTIDVSVMQTEIDEAIEKLDALIEKLQGKNIDAQTSELDASVEQSIAGGELKLDVALRSAKTQVDTTVTQGEQKLLDLAKRASVTEASLGNLSDESEDFFRGFNWSVRRVTSMMPGIRDAYRQVQSLQRIRMMGFSVGGIVSIALMVYSLYNLVMRYIAEQERKEREYRELIMRTQGYTNRRQFDEFQKEQERAVSMWRSRTIR
ncbi:MAG: hypothetical protein LBH74_07195 [Nitrososphaerota archaeon]|nr:hypothetical protein [Nitrososphaerota archaeon]